LKRPCPARRSLSQLRFGARSLAQLDAGAEPPQVLVSDIRMPGQSGLELLQVFKERFPALPVIIMTAYSDLESAVSAFQGGAFEYLPKPFDVDQALELIRRAIGESMHQSGAPNEVGLTPEILGQAPAMQEVFRAIGRLSQSSATVLITGESGSGKELVARAVHRHSPRAGQALHRDQHGSDSPRPARVRALRSRAWRFYRCGGAAARAFRTGRGRHAVPRRNRRHAGRTADAAAARPFRRPLLSRRRAFADEDPGPHHRRDSPESRSAGEVRGSFARTFSSPERDPRAAAEPARTTRGHSDPGAPFSAEKRQELGVEAKRFSEGCLKHLCVHSISRATCGNSKTSVTG
jgi:DNA-binding NarL/FixJ family response regulator